MARKLSKANIVLIFFAAILLLSVYAQIQYQTQMWSDTEPSYAIHADKLTEKPVKYFVLSNPDQYVLKVIDDKENYVIVHYDDTQIDELTRQYGTNNIEYNGSYYTIGIAFVDAFPTPTLPYILTGFVISISAIIILSIFQVVKYYKQPTKQTSSHAMVYPPFLCKSVPALEHG
jgi:hypothetical protein